MELARAWPVAFDMELRRNPGVERSDISISGHRAVKVLFLGPKAKWKEGVICCRAGESSIIRTTLNDFSTRLRRKASPIRTILATEQYFEGGYPVITLGKVIWTSINLRY